MWSENGISDILWLKLSGETVLFIMEVLVSLMFNMAHNTSKARDVSASILNKMS